VPADSVPFGSVISVNGKTVFAAYDGDTLMAIANTASDVRAKFKAAMQAKDLHEWNKQQRERLGRKS
jgi:hypothetical protein